MRRLVLSAGLAAAAALSTPAHASIEAPDLVHVRVDERGVGAAVGPEAHAIVGVAVNFDGTVCVAIGFSGTCLPGA